MRPRAWPVLVVFAGAKAAEFLIGVALIALATYAWLFAHPEVQGLSDKLLDQAMEPLYVRLESGFAFQSILHALTSLCALGGAAVGALASGETAQDALRLRRTETRPAVAAAAVAGCAAFQRALFAAFGAAGAPAPASSVWLAHVMPGASAARWAVLLVVFVLLPGAGIAVFFNGYLQTRLVRCWGRWAGIAAAAAAYGLMQSDRWAGVEAFLLGLFFGWMVERMGTVRWVAAGIMLANATALVFS